MDAFFQDIRYALRQMRKAPGFACTAIVILGLGIGGTTAIFSALNPILLEPLPYPQPRQLVMIWYADEDGTQSPQAFHTYQEVSERSRSFRSLAVMKPWQPALSGGEQPERVDGQQVSAEYFRTLGVTPALGRDFEKADDVLRGPKVVILSHGLWQRRFGGDRSIIGRQIRLDDNSYTVIGVMARGFENVLAPSAEAWSPLQYDVGNVAATDTREWGHHLRMLGRVREGVSPEQAKNDLASIANTSVAAFPRPRWASLAHGFIVDSLRDDLTRGVKPALLAVFGAVLLVLLIACVNVTNLVLARGAQRQGEIAMRAALGAGRARLMRQLLTESLLLAFIGSGVAIFVARAGIRGLVALSPAELPRLNSIVIDGAACAFAFAVSLGIGLAIGWIPSWQAVRASLLIAVQDNSGRTSGRNRGTRQAFVVAEVALALVLLVSGGLLLHSLRHLFSIPAGFDGADVLSMQVQTYGHRFDDDQARHRFFAQALEAVRRVPGVTASAFTSQLPLSGDSDIYGAHFDGDAPENAYAVYRYSVSPGYLESLRIPLRSGRLLNDGDTANTPRVMLISESLARRRFGDQDPIGKRVHVGGLANSPLFTIVGVVGDVKQLSLALNDSAAVYTTDTQWHWADATMSLVVRTRGDVTGYASAIKNAIWSVDNDQPIVRVARMDTLLAESAAQRRFVLILFEAFGFMALVLAATGMYGVLSGSVSERTREIGVRSALGASRGSIVGLILRQGMALTCLGALIGLAGATLATQAIASMLFGVSPLDPITYLGVIFLLGAVSAMACAIPAWRAAKVDPMVALRYE